MRMIVARDNPVNSVDYFKLVWLVLRLAAPVVAAYYLFADRWGLDNGLLIALLTVVILTYKFLNLQRYASEGSRSGERSQRVTKVYCRVERVAFVALSACEGLVLWAAQYKLGTPQAVALGAIGYVPYAALTYWAMNLRIKVEMLRGVESLIEDLKCDT